jgi:hypothetical protein
MSEGNKHLLFLFAKDDRDDGGRCCITVGSYPKGGTITTILDLKN